MNLLEAKELMRLTVSLIPPGRTVKKVPFAELEVVLRQSRVLAGKSELKLRRSQSIQCIKTTGAVHV